LATILVEQFELNKQFALKGFYYVSNGVKILDQELKMRVKKKASKDIIL